MIYITEGQGKESFATFVQAAEGRLDTNMFRPVFTDMQLSFIAAYKKNISLAIMVIDHSHAIKLLNGTIIRNRLEKAMENDLLKSTKLLLLTNPKNLEELKERKLKQVKDLDIMAAKAYQSKLAIQRVWQLPPQLSLEMARDVDQLGRALQPAGNVGASQEHPQPLRWHRGGCAPEHHLRRGRINNRIRMVFLHAHG